eukprot:6208810-Pleurochrysis_carterae.AAC.1
MKASASGMQYSSGEITIPIITLSTHGWMFPKEFKDPEEQGVAAAFAAVAVLKMQNLRLQKKQHGQTRVPLLGSMHVAHAQKAIESHNASLREAM